MGPELKIAEMALMNVLAGAAAWRIGRALGGSRWTDAALGTCVSFFAIVVAVTAAAGFAGALTGHVLLAGAAAVFVASLAIPGRAITKSVPPRFSLLPLPVGFFLPSRRLLSRES